MNFPGSIIFSFSKQQWLIPTEVSKVKNQGSSGLFENLH
jgi:hypothetical protein